MLVRHCRHVVSWGTRLFAELITQGSDQNFGALCDTISCLVCVLTVCRFPLQISVTGASYVSALPPCCDVAAHFRPSALQDITGARGVTSLQLGRPNGIEPLL